MNLNEIIIKIRVELQNSKIKKSGKNKFAGFQYYELSDFLPKLNELMLENGVNDNFTIKNDLATLILIKGDERQEYSIPFVMFDTPLSKSGKESMQPIQYLGALNTYYKRYCYLNAFGITDGEVIDSMDNSNNAPRKKQQPSKFMNDLLSLTENKPENNALVKKLLNGKKASDVPEVDHAAFLKAVATALSMQVEEGEYGYNGDLMEMGDK